MKSRVVFVYAMMLRQVSEVVLIERAINKMYLFAAWETGIRSRSRSSRSRLFSSVRRRSFRSAIDCLFFFIWPGSAASRDAYPLGMLNIERLLSDCDGAVRTQIYTAGRQINRRKTNVVGTYEPE